MRKAYVVWTHCDGKDTRQQFDDRAPAEAAVWAAISTVKVSSEEFAGRVQWSVENVPATKLDELLLAFAGDAQTSEALMGVDRDDPYLMIETSISGETWFSSGASPNELAEHHASQEYAGNWELVGIFDTRTGEEVHGTARTEVTF